MTYREGGKVSTIRELEKQPKKVDVVLLVRNEVLRCGLDTMLNRISGVGSVAHWNPENLPGPIDLREPGVLIVDIEQWKFLGKYFDLFKRDSTRIVVIGDDFERIDNARLSMLPCDGFLPMSGLSADLLDSTLERTLLGEMPMPPALARRLLVGTRQATSAPVHRSVNLTPRENEALTHLVEGMSNKQIARSLGISTHGAKRLVGSVLLKLDSPNRTAAVVTAIKLGLV
ncbi:DNA-binding response regulator, NarL/FixJ family, contains REC and HTH domains [Sinosporangium album]|uniref:DNA-binding response regulator, NarL/FixJ family, contains REC and HTH domains n=1 Tax=Sinosporangium album TaxID=504805 RepID=A0A1G8A6E2_9ACTN|nr:DNA-binding response regulator, NarL/FixJ family, contains REC and HTH domains [Sinosporangium album]